MTHNLLKYAAWDGTDWSFSVVDAAGNVGEATGLVLDYGGQPHISYYDSLAADLKYARWGGSAWSLETVDGANGDAVGSLTSIAVDSMNRPFIAYLDDTNGNLKLAQLDGSAWQIQTVDGSGTVGGAIQPGAGLGQSPPHRLS